MNPPPGSGATEKIGSTQTPLYQLRVYRPNFGRDCCLAPAGNGVPSRPIGKESCPNRAGRRGCSPLLKKGSPPRRGQNFRPRRGSFPRRRVLSRLWTLDIGLWTNDVSRPVVGSCGQLLCVVNYLLKEGDHTTRPADDISLTSNQSCHAAGSTEAKSQPARAELTATKEHNRCQRARRVRYFHSAINVRFAKISSQLFGRHMRSAVESGATCDMPGQCDLPGRADRTKVTLANEPTLSGNSGTHALGFGAGSSGGGAGAACTGG